MGNVLQSLCRSWDCCLDDLLLVDWIVLVQLGAGRQVNKDRRVEITTFLLGNGAETFSVTHLVKLPVFSCCLCQYVQCG